MLKSHFQYSYLVLSFGILLQGCSGRSNAFGDGVTNSSNRANQPTTESSYARTMQSLAQLRLDSSTTAGNPYLQAETPLATSSMVELPASVPQQENIPFLPRSYYAYTTTADPIGMEDNVSFRNAVPNDVYLYDTTSTLSSVSDTEGQAAKKRSTTMQVAHDDFDMESVEEAIQDRFEKLRKVFTTQSADRTTIFQRLINDFKQELARCDQKYCKVVRQLYVEHAEKAQLVKMNDALEKAHSKQLIAYEKDRKKMARTIEALHAQNNDLQSRIARLKGASLSQTERLLDARQTINPSIAFGFQEWAHYLAEISDDQVPSLPRDIHLTLNNECPFWKGKRIRDTHLLVMIPASVYGRPFTLDLLGELIKSPNLVGHASNFRHYADKVKEAFGEVSPKSPYWVLMPKYILPYSEGKTRKKQAIMVDDYALKTGFDYDLPSILEVATAVLTHYVRTGKRLYVGPKTCYVCCRENFFSRESIVAGGFSQAGFSIDLSSASNTEGIVCCLRFP